MMLLTLLFSTALTEIKRYAEHKRMEIHYVNKEILERMSAKRPHQVGACLFVREVGREDVYI